ncbi:urease accessory protein UreE [uncultured Litoreibacter sp.]|uniref:urease accessory protein UreE n=1 Tax=uncultured Litoreibacter sp. TaxID=1392394 RepID=UPI00261743DB|nr:urease accessory protein UreE [uncultured Litoreibacter sp.]
MLVASKIVKAGGTRNCTLSYEDRFLRRKVLTSDDGTQFLVDLAHTTSLEEGDGFALEDGSVISVRAALEPLLEITATNLLPLVWHIGNRHCPAQIEQGRVLVQPDHVIHDLMKKLGAKVREVKEPFTPEGGAYGHGRTHSHAH